MKLSAPASPPRASRRAFATMLVFTSMLFLAAAVVGISTLFAHEARRTRGMLAQTQLRQLLQAGVPVAQAELATGGAMQRTVPIAVPVEGATLSLHISPGLGQEARVRITGDFRGFHASQTVAFAPFLGAWIVSETQLEQTAQQ